MNTPQYRQGRRNIETELNERLSAQQKPVPSRIPYSTRLTEGQHIENRRNPMPITVPSRRSLKFDRVLE